MKGRKAYTGYIMNKYPQKGGSFGGQGKPSYGRKTWEDRSNGQMFQAKCANCGKMAEVPFRPNGKKPVYCKDCFATMGGRPSDDRGTRGGDRFPKKEFSNKRDDFRDRPRPDMAPRANDDMKRQIDALHIKVDRMMRMLEDRATSSPSMPSAAPAKMPKAPKKEAKAPAKAKAAPKKKAAKKK